MTPFRTPFILLTLCILVCCIIPAVTGDRLTAGLFTGPGTPGTPPQNVSVYISDANGAAAGRNWTSALFLTTRGLAYYPDNADLLGIQGYTYRKLGLYEKAVDTVSEAIAMEPGAVRYANRGYAYLALGNYPAALADAKNGIALNASCAPVYALEALALHGTGRDTEALSAIGTALSLEPENAHYWNVNGIILAAGDDCSGAAASLERSLAIDPGYDLPYPGFPSARESLDALNATCIPATQAQALPAPTRSSTGWAAVIGVIGALLVTVLKERSL